MQPEIPTTAPTRASDADLPDVWEPVTGWKHPYPSQGGWRALIFNATARKTSKGTVAGNGLIEFGVIRRVGRRVLVNRSTVSRALKAAREQGAAGLQ